MDNPNVCYPEKEARVAAKATQFASAPKKETKETSKKKK